jgi:diguanylate cyclase (GGDEF)-like protein
MRILEPHYTVYSASDGKTAIQMAEKHEPDLILLDIVMPGMDGYEVMRELKNMKITCRIPVIFATALDSPEDEEKGLSFDAADYIIKPFSSTIVRLRVSNQIRIVNQMRMIEQISMTDMLTDIPNRRSFESHLAMEWGRAIRGGTPISIFMLDIDRFKVYNDTYGHQQGDKALKTVAEILQGVLRRSSDYLARYGGEEFAAIAPNTEIDGALAIAEAMRREIEETVIALVDGSPSKLTISVGLHTYRPKTHDRTCDMLGKADKALYDAKNSGRNKVCKYQK